MLSCYTAKSDKSIPLHIVSGNNFATWLNKQSNFFQSQCSSSGFDRDDQLGMKLLVKEDGGLAAVILKTRLESDFWDIGALPLTLPEGEYALQTAPKHSDKLVLAWGLGAYEFTRYRKSLRAPAKLVVEGGAKVAAENAVQAISLVRDLINTPTDDMGPSELSAEVAKLAKMFNATFSETVGNELLKQNFNAIHTVGRASDDEPRLLDLVWGDKKHPKVTLVGKGVCFDTGGLDLKPSAGMLLMKKDMGGSANVLGLARMIMASELPVRLRVLIPAVENAVSGNAYRPGDVITMYSGKTVEIGNTDAEGRLVLADALALACEEKPDLLIDLATLTGAARVALGTDLPALFSNNDKLAKSVIEHSRSVSDECWHMPLYAGYMESLKSYLADMSNCSANGYGGAITAGLFLQEFVSPGIDWLHIDMMAWNLAPKPGRPQGGEALAIRALFDYLQKTYG